MRKSRFEYMMEKFLKDSKDKMNQLKKRDEKKKRKKRKGNVKNGRVSEE